MTPSPFTPAGLAISKIVAGIKPPPRQFGNHEDRYGDPCNCPACDPWPNYDPSRRDLDNEEEYRPPLFNDEPRVPGTPREEEEFA